MMIRKPPPDRTLHILSRLVTGRPESLFERDLEQLAGRIGLAVAGKRILVVGAAGSIGSSTVFELLRFAPGHLTLVDSAENNLVELLRTVRSSADTASADIALQPVDYGSPVMERLLADAQPFELVLNFAAAKHVRSERDTVSLLGMLETNLIKADRFLGWLRRHGHGSEGVFFVSSDKAANPANLMGASKRLMEHMLFWHTSPEACGRTLLHPSSGTGDPLRCATTARFANVAFSDGSLPWGFLRRLSRGQPLSGPSNVKRFFLSLEESGQLCTLAALACPDGHILVPRLDSDSDTRSFQDIAELTLRHFGYRPRWCASEAEAQAAQSWNSDIWPCYFEPSETMGEKLHEEFVARGETVVDIGFSSVKAVPQVEPPHTASLTAVFKRMRAWIENPAEVVNKAEIISLIQSIVPNFQHVASPKSLDRKM